MKGKQRSAQNRRSHGLYAKVLTGSDMARYEAVKEYTPGDILIDNFYLIQSKVLGILENDTQLNKESKILLQACEVLIENEELSQEFVDELRLKLMGLDVERLAKVLNSTVGLAYASVAMDKTGNVKAQLDVCKRFIIDILKNSQSLEDKKAAIAIISELKLEAGLPVEDIEAWLEMAIDSESNKAISEAEGNNTTDEPESSRLSGNSNLEPLPWDDLTSDPWIQSPVVRPESNS